MIDDQVSSAGRQLAANRKRVARRCERCKKAVIGLPKRRFCSAACRQAAYRCRRKMLTSN